MPVKYHRSASSAKIPNPANGVEPCASNKCSIVLELHSIDLFAMAFLKQEFL